MVTSKQRGSLLELPHIRLLSSCLSESINSINITESHQHLSVSLLLTLLPLFLTPLSQESPPLLSLPSSPHVLMSYLGSAPPGGAVWLAAVGVWRKGSGMAAGQSPAFCNNNVKSFFSFLRMTLERFDWLNRGHTVQCVDKVTSRMFTVNYSNSIWLPAPID